MFHPGEGDVWREAVFLRVEAHRDGPVLDGLVELRQLVAALPDAEPDDADVPQVREHPQPAEFGGEGADAAVGDGPDQLVGQVVGAVLLDLAEELERDVGLPGVDEVQPVGPLELLLDRPDLAGQPVEVDADEQSHTGPSGRSS